MCCLLCEAYNREPGNCIQNPRTRLIVETRLYMARCALSNWPILNAGTSRVGGINCSWGKGGTDGSPVVKHSVVTLEFKGGEDAV